jgi:hypothetical protein
MRLDKTLAAALCDVEPTYREYLRNDGTLLVKLQRALYGCVESARLWYKTLRSVLEADDYIANPVEPCIFNKYVNGVQCTIVVFVDDLIATCKDESIISESFNKIGMAFNCQLTVHDGPIVPYLGMIFDFNEKGAVSISMPAYVDQLLKLAEVSGTASTPAGLNLFTVDSQSPLLDKIEAERYHSMVARLLYLAKRTRADLLLTVSFLTTRVQAPTKDDASKLKRALKYLNGTKNLALRLIQDPSNTVHAYIDASYGVHSDYRSHTGMLITLGAGVVDARSIKQKLNTKSSTEAELVGLSDMCGKAIWHREFLAGQGLNPPPARIYQDNQSTMAMINNGASTSDRTRHVAIRYYWVKDRIDKKEVEVVYCPTHEMVADLLTKPLVGEAFIRLRNAMLNLTC